MLSNIDQCQVRSSIKVICTNFVFMLCDCRQQLQWIFTTIVSHKQDYATDLDSHITFLQKVNNICFSFVIILAYSWKRFSDLLFSCFCCSVMFSLKLVRCWAKPEACNFDTFLTNILFSSLLFSVVKFIFMEGIFQVGSLRIAPELIESCG